MGKREDLRDVEGSEEDMLRGQMWLQRHLRAPKPTGSGLLSAFGWDGETETLEKFGWKAVEQRLTELWTTEPAVVMMRMEHSPDKLLISHHIGGFRELMVLTAPDRGARLAAPEQADHLQAAKRFFEKGRCDSSLDWERSRDPSAH